MRRSLSGPGDPSWHRQARIPIPPEHPAAKAWAEPGEVIYPGLGAIDWQQYLDTIWQPNRRKRVREANRTLFLTNRRIIVVDDARKLKTDLPLTDVEDVSVGMPPGAPDGMPLEEAVVHVTFRAGPERRVVGWSTVKRDVELFAEMLRELVNALAGEASPAVGADPMPPPRTGYTLPMFSADESEFAPSTPLADGLRFGESLIPWSDIDRAATPAPGTMVFHFKSGTRSSALFPGFGIRVPELGDAETVWRDFVAGRGVPVAQQT